MSGPEAIGVVRRTLERYLEESFGTYEIDAEQDFVIRRGSTLTFLRPLPWKDEQTLVRIWAITNVAVPVSGGLTRFLATETGKFVFGAFSLAEDRGAVLFGHTLLGDFLSKKELEEAVAAVSSTADLYDDQIKARFGGRLLAEEGEGVPAPTTPVRRPVQRVFALLGTVAGVAAAVAAYRWIDDSWWLSAYAFLLTSYAIARGLGDLVTDRQKLRRAAYFALQPVLGTAVLYGVHEAWGRWWLAVLLAVFGGGLVAGLTGPLLFPRIHREETVDTAERWRASI